MLGSWTEKSNENNKSIKKKHWHESLKTQNLLSLLKEESA